MKTGSQSGKMVRQHHDLATGNAVNNRGDTRDLGGGMKKGGKVMAKGGKVGKKGGKC